MVELDGQSLVERIMARYDSAVASSDDPTQVRENLEASLDRAFIGGRYRVFDMKWQSDVRRKGRVYVIPGVSGASVEIGSPAAGVVEFLESHPGGAYTKDEIEAEAGVRIHTMDVVSAMAFLRKSQAYEPFTSRGSGVKYGVRKVEPTVHMG